MNMHVDFLIERNSAARLAEHAPNRSEKSVMLRSAFRVRSLGLKPVRSMLRRIAWKHWAMFLSKL